MKSGWFLAVISSLCLITLPAKGIVPTEADGCTVSAEQTCNGLTDPFVSTDWIFTVDWYYEGDEDGDDLGHSVGTAGDVNNDGYGDVIVGAPKDTHTVSREGVAYVFYGSPAGPSNFPDWQVGGGERGSLFGASVGTAGDVNGDGYDDVIVGAYDYKNAQTKAGAAFVFHGSSGGLSTVPDWVFVSDQGGANLGFAVGTAGDVNGDGYDDVIVGARWYSAGGTAFVFHGSESGLMAIPSWSAEGDQAVAGFGAAVGTAGDVNHDGYSDVVVGAPLYDDGAEDEGAAFVFYGSVSGLSASPDWAAYGGQAGAEFGTSVATAGTVNYDDYADIIVGAPFYDQVQTDGGAAFLFHGADSGPSTTYDWMAYGQQSGSGFGLSVGAAGDTNGDGYDDAIVGAYRYEHDQSEEGGAFIFHGSAAGLTPSPAWVAEGDKAETWFGYAVGTAGNVNRDGYADIIVGAPQYRHFTDIVGRAFVYHGPIEAQPKFLYYLPLIVTSP